MGTFAVGTRIQHQHALRLADEIRQICASADAATVAVVSQKSVRVFSNYQEVAHWDLPEETSEVSLSADGGRLSVVGKSPNITVHDVQSGKVSTTLSRDGAPDFLRSDTQVHAAIYPDGNSLVSIGSKQRLYVSDMKSGRWQYIMFIKQRKPKCAVSPTGQHVVLLGEPNESELAGHVTVFAVNHGLQRLWTKFHEDEGPATWAAFRSDGMQLATGAPDGVRVWNTQDGSEVHHSMIDNPGAVGGCFVSSRELLIATPDELKVFNLSNGKSTKSAKCEKQIVQLSSSVDGKVVVTRSETTVDFWTITPDPGANR